MTKLYKKSGEHRLGTIVQAESQLQSHPRRQSSNHEDPSELPQIVLDEGLFILGGNGAFSKLSWFQQDITLALAAVACAKPQLLGPETQLLLGHETQLPALGLGQVQVRSQSPQAIYYHVQTYDNAIQPVAVQPQQYHYVPLAYNQYYYNQAAAIRTPLSKADAVRAGSLTPTWAE